MQRNIRTRLAECSKSICECGGLSFVKRKKLQMRAMQKNNGVAFRNPQEGK